MWIQKDRVGLLLSSLNLRMRFYPCICYKFLNFKVLDLLKQQLSRYLLGRKLVRLFHLVNKIQLINLFNLQLLLQHLQLFHIYQHCMVLEQLLQKLLVNNIQVDIMHKLVMLRILQFHINI